MKWVRKTNHAAHVRKIERYRKDSEFKKQVFETNNRKKNQK